MKEAPATLESAGLGPSTQTTSPMITGASVLACKYKDGVMVIADTLGSYGSLARFTSLERIRAVNATTIVAGSGEYSDFQWVMKLLTELSVMDWEEDDGRQLTPNEVHAYLSRVFYNKRSKVDPLWNTVITAGVKDDGKAFCGVVDLYGSCYEDDYAATGFGAYLAIPLLRKSWRADLEEKEARALLETAMTVCFYRDCKALNKYVLATVTKDGPRLSAPYALPTKWDYKAFVKVNM